MRGLGSEQPKGSEWQQRKALGWKSSGLVGLSSLRSS